MAHPTTTMSRPGHYPRVALAADQGRFVTIRPRKFCVSPAA